MAVTVRAWFRHPLTRNSAFMHLWAGQTAAQVGFQVGTLATSAIAISVLRASETQIGVLSALQTLAFLTSVCRRVPGWMGGVSAAS